MINYYLITKPGIITGNLVTFAAGFLLASGGEMRWGLFLATLIGLACVLGSACVFNNFIDRNVDQKMQRTKGRALAAGHISKRSALCFATALGLVGGYLLLAFTNGLTVAVTAFGFFVYAVLYSLWKCHTVYGTAIGSVAGAVPPVIGYCAVSNQLDAAAWILFAMMIFWQMPHFFAVAIYHLDDYSAAKIPVLPVMKGLWRTKWHMVVYIVAFLVVSALLTLFNYTGYGYLAVTMVLGVLWLVLCVRGFTVSNDRMWARDMWLLV